MTKQRYRRYLMRSATSRQVFWFAMAATLLVAVLGSVTMFVLFQTGGERPSNPQVLSGDTLNVVVGRTAGGPPEWVAYARALATVQEEIGRPIKVRYEFERLRVVDTVSESRPDFAFVSIYQYLRLRESGVFELLAEPVIRGNPQDSLVVVVRSDSQFRTIEDLQGATIALGAGRSLSGFAHVKWLMAERGTTIEEFFGRARAGAENDANLMRVANGTVDATSVNRSQLASWPEGRFRIVSESPPIGVPPVVVRSDLPAALRAELSELLMSLGPGRGLPADSAVIGFRPVEHKDYSFGELLLDYTDPSILTSSWPEGS